MEKQKILVVDDEEDIRVYLTALLEENGFEVTSAKDGEEALQKLKNEGPPDLITLDLMMPNKTGVKLYRELRKDEQLQNIPIVICTGFTTDMNVFVDFKKFIYRRKIKAPDGYIEKPIDEQALVAAINQALTGSQP